MAFGPTELSDLLQISGLNMHEISVLKLVDWLFYSGGCGGENFIHSTMKCYLYVTHT